MSMIETTKFAAYENLAQLLTAKEIKYRECKHIAAGKCEEISKIRGNELRQAMKAMVMMIKLNKKDRAYYLAVIPADQRLDKNEIGKLSNVAGREVMFAPEDRARELTGCEMGAVPPFSFNPQLHLVVDRSIFERSLVNSEEEVVFNAGRLDCSFFMAVGDYIKLVEPTAVFADIILKT